MSLGDNIYLLRTKAGLSQAEFADCFHVSHQSVQKWESGRSKPSLEMVIRMAKVFNISVDAILFDHSIRSTEKEGNRKIYPSYSVLPADELYSEQLEYEYQQLLDEGVDVAEYKDLFFSVAKMKPGTHKIKMGDILFDLALNAPLSDGYPYREPSDLPSIRGLRKPYYVESRPVLLSEMRDKISGAWTGRICGCLLGKPIEGIHTDELIPFLKETNNYPLRRYILRSDITEEMIQSFNFSLLGHGGFTDTVPCAPVDDDTNYTVLYQEIINKFGINFTPQDVSQAWLSYQPKDAYFTAERVAFRNFVLGFNPPNSAIYQNPYREWIGAQIRADYFGYINPGNPEMAAEMAWRDACISHTKNGIYGEMFVAAMLAHAAVCEDMVEIVKVGLGQIPSTSRLYESISHLLEEYQAGIPKDKIFKNIHAKWNEFNLYHWCHTLSNAEIVVASLLYGNGNFQDSICMAVQAGFDTDCNGATVGSVIGMKNGIKSIPNKWISPLNGELNTSLFGIGKVQITNLVEKTMGHLKNHEVVQIG